MSAHTSQQNRFAQNKTPNLPPPPLPPPSPIYRIPPQCVFSPAPDGTSCNDGANTCDRGACTGAAVSVGRREVDAQASIDTEDGKIIFAAKDVEFKIAESVVNSKFVPGARFSIVTMKQDLETVSVSRASNLRMVQASVIVQYKKMDPYLLSRGRSFFPSLLSSSLFCVAFTISSELYSIVVLTKISTFSLSPPLAVRRDVGSRNQRHGRD